MNLHIKVGYVIKSNNLQLIVYVALSDSYIVNTYNPLPFWK